MEGIGVLGRLLIVTGLVIAVVGALMVVVPKIPWLGRLPGDIVIRRDNFTFYLPLATCVLLSVLLTGILWLVNLLKSD